MFEAQERNLSIPALKTAGSLVVEGVVSAEVTAQSSQADIMLSLSPEKQERAEALKQAMAERFGLHPEDFGLVRIETDEAGEALPEPKVVVMLTSSNGLYKGSITILWTHNQIKTL